MDLFALNFDQENQGNVLSPKLSGLTLTAKVQFPGKISKVRVNGG